MGSATFLRAALNQCCNLNRNNSGMLHQKHLKKKKQTNIDIFFLNWRLNLCVPVRQRSADILAAQSWPFPRAEELSKVGQFSKIGFRTAASSVDNSSGGNETGAANSPDSRRPWQAPHSLWTLVNPSTFRNRARLTLLTPRLNKQPEVVQKSSFKMTRGFI